MDKNEYLEIVTGQIRFDKAKKVVADELDNHIEDQKEAFRLNGMSESESIQKTIEEMGDPVEVGIALDRIHRPKIEWKMLLIVFVLSLLGLLLQYLMLSDMGTEVYPYNINTQLINVIVGSLIMLFFCFFDYTRIGLFGKFGAVTIILLLIFNMMYGLVLNGQSGYLRFFGITLSLHQLVYLYIPFFGGILYSYKNKTRVGFIKSIIWMVFPILLVLRLPSLSLASSLLLIMMVQMCFVIKKGWFLNCKIKLNVIVSAIIGIPVVTILYFLFFGAEYQKARLISVVNLSGDINYQMRTARGILLGSTLLGQSTIGVGGILSDVPSDFILTYIFSYFGILAAIVLMAVLGLFIFKMFKITIHQKNQLGLVIGLGCGLVFAVQIIIYVLVNLTIIPTTSVFLPLISYGRTGTIVSYSLIGILLSIYRYQNVLPANPVRSKLKDTIAKS